jgi:acyl-CoA thioester hydrolase
VNCIYLSAELRLLTIFVLDFIRFTARYNLAMTKFPLKLSLRLDWSEMDLYGHINNVSYFKYLQAARVYYWETLGLSKMFEEEKKGPILASSGIDFRRPLHYPGNIVVQSGIDVMGKSSFTILHQILNEKQEVCAEGKDVVVFFDFILNQKMEVTAEIRKMVEEMEK